MTEKKIILTDSILQNLIKYNTIFTNFQTYLTTIDSKLLITSNIIIKTTS